MSNEFIRTANYSKFYEMVSSLHEMERGLWRFGICYGSFGLGKSIALAKIADEFNGVSLRANVTWSVHSLLQELMMELRVPDKFIRGKRTSDMLKSITDYLLVSERLIIIDEADTLMLGSKFRIMELLRTIMDITYTPMVFVGMGSFVTQLQKHPHYYDRVSEEVMFLPADENDISKLCGMSVVKIERDLVAYLATKYSNFRAVKLLIKRVERFCDENGLEGMSKEIFLSSGVENVHKRK